MFAFALWDRGQGRLLLARDRLGIKPLYYAVTDQELLFASEIKAILAASQGRPRFNTAVVPEFLASRFVAGEETFFHGIQKLLPGHTLTWSLEDGIRRRRYWQLPASVDETPRTLVQEAGEVRQRLEEAGRGQLISEVPPGPLLSGGPDSGRV